jgi:type IV secretory pathway TraG/TraD family ATPase VirD4
MLHAAALGGVEAATMIGWVNRRHHQTPTALLEGTGTAADLLAGLLETDERELSGIWSTASGVLAAYRSDAALRSAASPNFDADMFVASADTVYVCASGRHQELVGPLVAGLVADVRAAAFARAASRLGSPQVVAPATWSGGEPPLLLALDEVANIAPLGDLPALVSEGGGQGVLTLACFQDLSQARHRWGASADGFGSLFGATVVLPGIGDVRTLEALSVRCGSHDVWVRSESRGKSRSQSWSTRRQRRIDPDQIARGRPGHALVVGGDRPPSWTPVTPHWAIRRWRVAPSRGLRALER